MTLVFSGVIYNHHQVRKALRFQTWLGNSDCETLVEGLAQQLGCGQVVVDQAVAKVSVVGMGMIDHPGVAARMFQALSDQGINLQMIVTSEIKISCVVAAADGVRALQAVHSAFDLAGTEVVVMPA